MGILISVVKVSVNILLNVMGYADAFPQEERVEFDPYSVEPASGGARVPPAPHWKPRETLHSLIDDTLVQVIRVAGWPKWHTSGHGGQVPRKQECDFASDQLKWCARLDFYRGEPCDDLKNEKWAKVLASLPGYSSVLVKQQNPQSVEAKGNAMEMAVGLAYTCYREFMNLPEGHRIEFRDGMQEKATILWGVVWALPKVGPQGDATHV